MIVLIYTGIKHCRFHFCTLILKNWILYQYLETVNIESNQFHNFIPTIKSIVKLEGSEWNLNLSKIQMNMDLDIQLLCMKYWKHATLIDFSLRNKQMQSSSPHIKCNNVIKQNEVNSLISQVIVPTLHYIKLADVRPEGDLWPSQQPDMHQSNSDVAQMGRNFIPAFLF